MTDPDEQTTLALILGTLGLGTIVYLGTSLYYKYWKLQSLRERRRTSRLNYTEMVALRTNYK